MSEFQVLVDWELIYSPSAVTVKVTTPEVAKMVSRAWKAMSATERKPWLQKAIRDKARFDREKANYTGRWKAPRKEKRKKKKDPGRPKRPISAFFDYCNKHRKEAQEQNPTLKLTEITALLAKMWKDAPQDERVFFSELYLSRRLQYKAAMAEYKKKMDLKHREEITEGHAVSFSASKDSPNGSPRAVSFDLEEDQNMDDKIDPNRNSKEIVTAHAQAEDMASSDGAPQDCLHAVSFDLEDHDPKKIGGTPKAVDWEPIPFTRGGTLLEAKSDVLAQSEDISIEEEEEERENPQHEEHAVPKHEQTYLAAPQDPAYSWLMPIAASLFPHDRSQVQKHRMFRWAQTQPPPSHNSKHDSGTYHR